MITGELRSRIDKVWKAFWTCGLSNPITVIERMTYLLFIRRLDEIQDKREQKAAFLNRPALNPTQIRFVDTLIDYLTVNGLIEKFALFELPFTDIASNGLIDVFNQKQATQIVQLVEKVNGNAMAV